MITGQIRKEPRNRKQAKRVNQHQRRRKSKESFHQSITLLIKFHWSDQPGGNVRLVAPQHEPLGDRIVFKGLNIITHQSRDFHLDGVFSGLDVRRHVVDSLPEPLHSGVTAVDLELTDVGDLPEVKIFGEILAV